MKQLLGKPTSVLIVDDEIELLELTASDLEKWFGHVYTAHNGKAALQVMRANTIDVVVTDYKMPVIDGLHLAEEIKTHYPLTPVIMVTGHSTHQSVLEALKYGVYDVLEKPYYSSVLVNRIQNALLYPHLIRFLWALGSRGLPFPSIQEFMSLSINEQFVMINELAIAQRVS